MKLKIFNLKRRGSQVGHGECLKNIRFRFDSGPRHQKSPLAGRFQLIGGSLSCVFLQTIREKYFGKSFFDKISAEMVDSSY